MRRLAVLVMLLIVGCGPVRGGADLGDPIYVLHATLEDGYQLAEPEGEFRAVFGWLSYGGGPWPECVAAAESIADCGFARPTDYETRFTIFDVPAVPRFPGGIDVLFYDFPDDEQVMSFGESKFALGGMAIYDDRNFNGELDPIEPGETEPIDELVAESIVTNLRTLAVFQEGPEHPIKQGIDVILGCPRAPFGYSVGTYVPREGCSIDEDIPLLVTRSDPMQVGRARCGGTIAGLDIINADLKPPETLPPNANIRCGSANEIYVWLDNGAYCDRYRETRYALVSRPGTPPQERWDLRDDPPSYWTCEVRGGS